MLEDMDANAGLDSSTDLNTDAAAETPEVELAGAESSDAQDGTKDTLSLVRDVVGEKKPSEAASSAEGGVEGQQPEVSQPKTLDNDKFTDVPFHQHPRFKEVLRQRDSFKEDATRYQNVQNFLDTNGLGADEAADGLQIMALAKTDPAAAWERMKPFVQNLLVAAGEVLPDELSARVQRGELTVQAAQELSRVQAQLRSTQQGQSFKEQLAQKTQQQTAIKSNMDAAASWEADRRIKDPNYEAKSVQLRKEILFLQSQEGIPGTPEGVKDQLNRAYAAIVLPQQTAPARPKPTQKSPTSAQISGNSAPSSGSTLDIIRAHRQR